MTAAEFVAGIGLIAICVIAYDWYINIRKHNE
jgi:hypothetical protein